MKQHHEVLVLGSGPAGATAAIYASRAHLSTALISGPMPGGQISTTTTIENFPGFPEGIQGPQLGMLVEKQARRFGTDFIFDIIHKVDLSKRPFTLHGQETSYTCDSLIIATGSKPRRLDIPSEQLFENRGLSYCATCDGRFFENKVVGVVGGGDSALEEALYLSRLASKVYIIHRRDALRAGPLLQKRAREEPRIEFIWNATVADLQGDDAGLTEVLLRVVPEGGHLTLEMNALFVAVGHTPNSQLFTDWLDLDDQGYIVADCLTHTSIQGVFAAGDIADPNFRQAITAAGTGCRAGMEAARFLEAVGPSDTISIDNTAP